MNLNLTLLGQMISFAFFVWFCMKYVWPPVMEALNERQNKIAQGLADAEQGSQKRAEAESEIEQMLTDAKAQAAEIVAQAQKRGNEIIEESKDGARSEGERLKQAAQAEIEQEVVQARESLRSQVGNIAVSGAGNILGQEISPQSHAKIIDELVSQI